VVLICWTVLDPAQKTTGYELTSAVTPDGATVVKAQYFCSSSSSLWIYLTYGLLFKRVKFDKNSTNRRR